MLYLRAKIHRVALGIFGRLKNYAVQSHSGALIET